MNTPQYNLKRRLCVMLSIHIISMSACLGRSDAGVYVHKPSTTNI